VLVVDQLQMSTTKTSAVTHTPIRHAKEKRKEISRVLKFEKKCKPIFYVQVVATNST